MYFWVGTDWSCSAYTDHLNIPKFTGNGFVNGLSFYRPQMECQNPWQLGMVFDIIPFDRM